jgi:hypothetical protein
MEKKIGMIVIFLLFLAGCMPDIEDFTEQPEKKDFYLVWKYYHQDCFGPQNQCYETYINDRDFHLFVWNNNNVTMDLKGLISQEAITEIKLALFSLNGQEPIIQNTPSCQDVNAGFFNLTYHFEGDHSFTKIYCVFGEVSWFEQIQLVEAVLVDQSSQFGYVGYSKDRVVQAMFSGGRFI